MRTNGNYPHRKRPEFITWLTPGMHVKRWILLTAFGVTLFGLGVGYFLRELYIVVDFPGEAYWLTLQFIPRTARGILFILLAVGTIAIGVWGLSRSLVSATLAGREERLVDVVYEHRRGRRSEERRVGKECRL